MPFALFALILAPAVLALIAAHKFVAGVVAWLLFSAIVDGMPKPLDSSPFGYRWLYASLNLLAANTTRVLCAVSPRFTTLFGKGPIPPE